MPDLELSSAIISNVDRVPNTYINKEWRIGYADIIGFVNFVLLGLAVIIFVFIIIQ